MKKRIWKILLALMVCLALGGSASAAIVTVEVTGIVDSFSTSGGFSLDDSVSVGSVMTGFCIYDTNTPDEDPSGYTGVYPIISLSMTIGNYIFEHNSISSEPALFEVGIADIGYWARSSNGIVSLNGVPQAYNNIYIELLDLCNYSSFGSHDALPVSFPDISFFNHTNEFEVSFSDSGVGFNITGELTSITAVTEPVTYYVDGDNGSDNNDGLSSESAFATILKSIDVAFGGDVVLVADGTYTGQGNRDIEVYGKSITIRNENGPGNCIIDCNGSEDEPHTGFYFHGISSNSNLSGFTVTNGYSKYGPGGGISCYGANITISDCNISGNTVLHSRGGYGGGISVMDGIYSIYNCTISNNSTENGSGGISCRDSVLTVSNCTINNNFGRDGGGIGYHHGYDSSLSINNCTFSDNLAYLGGGIYCDGSSPTIKNCNITGNEAYWGGGGIYCDGGSPTITNCVINGNTTGESERGDGGGIFCYVSDPVISNCTIVGNEARGNDGSGGGICCYGGDSMVSNCILWNNTGLRGSQLAKLAGRNAHLTISYNDIEGGSDGVYADGGIVNWLEGNINVDPCFADPGLWDSNGTPEDANDDFFLEGDYHLLPDSLCIDAGDPCYVPEPNETDLDGNPRITNGRIDMGTYEFIPPIEVSMKLTPQRIIRHSRNKLIMAWLRLPEGITKDQIDSNEPLLLYPGGIEAKLQYVFEHGKKGDKRVRIFAFFDKSELMEAVPDNGQVQLEVVGYLTTSQEFYGTDFVTILDRRQPRKHRLGR